MPEPTHVALYYSSRSGREVSDEPCHYFRFYAGPRELLLSHKPASAISQTMVKVMRLPKLHVGQISERFRHGRPVPLLLGTLQYNILPGSRAFSKIVEPKSVFGLVPKGFGLEGLGSSLEGRALDHLETLGVKEVILGVFASNPGEREPSKERLDQLRAAKIPRGVPVPIGVASAALKNLGRRRMSAGRKRRSQ